MAIKYHYDIEQGTDEWHHLRLGVVTASNINVILTATGKPAKNEKMRQYACEIAAQRELKVVEDNFQSYDMIRGHIQEDIARDIYSETLKPVKQCGFITNDNYDAIIGCSPDGLVGDKGGIEIKSRLAKFQFATIISDEMPSQYMNQIQTFMLVSGREWCDFVQYSNGLPLFVKRIFPDDERRDAIICAFIEFENEIDKVRYEYKKASAGMIQTEYVNLNFDDEMEVI